MFDLVKLSAKANSRRLRGYCVLVCKVCFHIKCCSPVESFSEMDVLLSAVKGIFNLFILYCACC